MHKAMLSGNGSSCMNPTDLFPPLYTPALVEAAYSAKIAFSPVVTDYMPGLNFNTSLCPFTLLSELTEQAKMAVQTSTVYDVLTNELLVR